MSKEYWQRSKCKESGKISYKRADAGNMLHKLMLAGMLLGDYERTEKNIYQCKFCNAWHLTSQRGQYTELYERSIIQITPAIAAKIGNSYSGSDHTIIESNPLDINEEIK